MDLAGVRSSRAGLAFTDLSVLLVAVIWGSSYVAMQVVGRSVPPASFLALRFAAAIPVLLILAPRSLSRLTRNEVATGSVFGVLLFGILILETIGVKHTSAANSGFLISVSVILVPVLERLISGKSQPVIVYLAMIAAIGGCGMLLLSGGLHPRAGDLIILAAALIRATQITLFGRRSSNSTQSLLNVTRVQFVVVCLLACGSSIVADKPVWQAVPHLSLTAWLLIIYLGVLGTSFAFYAQLRAARAASSTRVGLILCTEPVFSTIFAVFAAGESISPIQICGGILVLGSSGVGRAAEGTARPRTAPPPMACSTPAAVAAASGARPPDAEPS